MNWVVDNLGLIVELTVIHLRQSLIPIALGLVLSLPLGWVAWRYRLVRGPVIVLTGLLYTIPSLALLILMPAALGYSVISERNLIAALTIYAVAILVRAVADGLDSVDEGVLQASTAMGYAAPRRFFTIELPLAGPVILAGLRVTAVSTISLATSQRWQSGLPMRVRVVTSRPGDPERSTRRCRPQRSWRRSRWPPAPAWREPNGRRPGRSRRRPQSEARRDARAARRGGC